jgi:hypothetical protein
MALVCIMLFRFFGPRIGFGSGNVGVVTLTVGADLKSAMSYGRGNVPLNLNSDRMLPALCECDGCFIYGILFIFLFSCIWEIENHIGRVATDAE